MIQFLTTSNIESKVAEASPGKVVIYARTVREARDLAEAVGDDHPCSKAH